MQRLILFIPIAFLLFINSCALASPDAGVLNQVDTAVAGTNTAAMWTAVPTQTFNPYISIMISWLNAELVAPTNSLAWSMDAKYSVMNISFPNHSPIVFRVDVNCICTRSNDCCIPERTFVVIVESLKKNSGSTLAQVPPDVSQLMVVCFDQANAQIGAVSAPWQAVQRYLQGSASGYELGAQVTLTVAP